MSVPLDAAFNYHDLNSLQGLKQGAGKDNPDALKAVAQQFESMFMSLVIKSMREASDVMASDLENSYQTRFYRDMHDQQMALSLSQQGGFGLADVLYQQLLPSEPSQPLSGEIKSLAESTRAVLPLATPAQTTIEQLSTPEQTVTEELPMAAAEDAINLPLSQSSVATTQAKTDSTEVSNSPADKGRVFQSPQEFVQQLLPIAEKVASALGVNPKIMVAQAALETGWGKHVIEQADGDSSYNFFGIKSDQRWQGPSATTLTHEYVAGHRIAVKAPFRVYASAEASFNDYVSFIKESDRYQPALAKAGDDASYLQALQQAGYATDPNYATKILRIAHGEWLAQG